MKRNINLSLLLLTGLINLAGCVSTDQKPNGFTEMQEKNVQSLRKKRIGKLKNRPIQYFIVAKLKSVNEQPQAYLEFKSKRLSDRTTCVNWVSENNQLLTRSLHELVRNRKKGYFVDNIKCLRTALLVTRYDEKAISI